MRPHIVVLGLMGAGKSTVATALGARLSWPVRDSDADIEALTGRTGRSLAADPAEGVEALHRLEEAVLLGALAAEQPTVIAAAGWVVESPRCRAAMARRAEVIWLDVPVDVLAARMATGQHRRSMSLADLEATAAHRGPLFAAVADFRLDAGEPAEKVAVAANTALDQGLAS